MIVISKIQFYAMMVRCRWVPALAMLLCLQSMLPVFAADGRVEVIRAETREVAADWLLDAQLDVELSDKAIEALKNGVMLSFKVQFELTRQRSFWTNAKELTTSREFELKYLALNERYVVLDVATGEQQNYATLFSALRNMGLIRDWSVVAASRIAADEDYVCGLRVVLDQDRLPGPLQLLAFWRGDFTLESEWYEWNLR